MDCGAFNVLREHVNKVSQEELNNTFCDLTLETKRKIWNAIESSQIQSRAVDAEEVSAILQSSAFLNGSHKLITKGSDANDDNVSTIAPSWESIEALQGPHIVCGFEGLFVAVGNDLHTIGHLVAEILQECGWSDVSRASIVVEDKSGHGGSKTFKVIGQQAYPPQVAVHARSKSIIEDPISEERAAAAAAVFGQAGVSPARLAQGEDWYIETWEGITHNDLGDLTEDIARDLGALMASIHRIPIAWYDSFRTQICVLKPNLASATRGSHFWKESCRLKNLDFMDKSTEELWAGWFVNEPTPSNRISARVVTCHGDFHRGNIIRTEEGVLKAIDLEFSSVMCAAWDINYAFNAFCKSLEIKRAFVDGYLRALGEGVDADEIDDLILDTECYTAISQQYWEIAQHADTDYCSKMFLIERYRAIRDAAQSSMHLRQEIVENGFMKCAPAMELRAETARSKYVALKPPLPLAMADRASPVVELASLPSPAVPEEARPRWPLNITAAQVSCACWVALAPCDETNPAFFQVMTLCAAEVGKGLGDFRIYWTEGSLTFNLDGNEAEPDNGGDVDFKLHAADGAWHHLAILYDSDEQLLRLFFDGECVDSRKFELAFPIRLTSISVGEQRAEGKEKHLAEGTRFIEGRLRDFSMYTRILSAEEIVGMYTSACDGSGKPPFELPTDKQAFGTHSSDEQNHELLCVLMSMGVPEEQAAGALHATGWSSVERALEVAIGSMPMHLSGPSEHDKLAMLEQVQALGFDAGEARAALEAIGWAGAEVAITHLLGD